MRARLWAVSVTALLAVWLLVGLGCGRKRPVNLAEADVSALGSGIGRELRTEVGGGDRILVFGVPGAIGYTEELERAIVRGIEDQVKADGAEVSRVQYTPAESEEFLRGRYTTLHPAFAGEAFARHGTPAPQVVVSLIGWPFDQELFLPTNIVWVGVSWEERVDPARWLPHFDGVISIRALGGPVAGRPSRSALRKPADVEAWFDDRFEVVKEVRP